MTKEASHPDYPAFLAALKERVLHARTTAARAVNRDLILLYWDIGRAIVQKQQSAGWGSAIVQRLAADLRVAFPDMRGFSADNLWRMKQFFVHYSSSEFLEQAVPELKVRAKTLTIWSTQENLLEQPVPASTASTTVSLMLTHGVASGTTRELCDDIASEPQAQCRDGIGHVTLRALGCRAACNGRVSQVFLIEKSFF